MLVYVDGDKAEMVECCCCERSPSLTRQPKRWRLTSGDRTRAYFHTPNLYARLTLPFVSGGDCLLQLELSFAEMHHETSLKRQSTPHPTLLFRITQGACGKPHTRCLAPLVGPALPSSTAPHTGVRIEAPRRQSLAATAEMTVTLATLAAETTVTTTGTAVRATMTDT